MLIAVGCCGGLFAYLGMLICQYFDWLSIGGPVGAGVGFIIFIKFFSSAFVGKVIQPPKDGEA